MADSSSRTYWKILISLSLVHFSGDFYSSFINPLFPVFMDKMGLSLAQVGFLAGISRFLMFIVQPISGYWADRHPSRSYVLIGLLMPILFIPLAGIPTSFYGLMFCVVIGSTGSSLFHPPVTGMVPQYAGRNLGLAMSIYNTAGTSPVTWPGSASGQCRRPWPSVFRSGSIYIGSSPNPKGTTLPNTAF
jgi:FSR family fosmidomycin resistance protein-like MFS transporter